MKNAFTIFIAAIILVSSMSNGILYMGYKLNQNEIERLYCINKLKPGKGCHGKCHLTKQLAENNRHDSQQSPFSNLEDSFKLNFFYQPSANMLLNDDVWVSKFKHQYNPLLISRSFGEMLFRPPDSQRINC